MRLAIGSDPAGFGLKVRLMPILQEWGHQVVDYGCDSKEPADYPRYAARVGKAVATGEAERGILICGTGQGMAISANKVEGVRAALCVSPLHAVLSREHNDTNVLCFGAWAYSDEEVRAIAEAWLFGKFNGAPVHKERVEMMDRINEL